jgi:glutathione S-transferase
MAPCRYQDCGKLKELSPKAVKKLQTACTLAITQTYADGVEALVFVPPPRSELVSSTSELAAATVAAAEAAMKIQKNKKAIVDDILTKSGIARPTKSVYGTTYMSVNGHRPRISSAVRLAVELVLDQLCNMLLTGDPGPKADDPEAAAVGTAALAFFRNRASAPRDMSAAATVQFRAACDALLAQLY